MNYAAGGARMGGFRTLNDLCKDFQKRTTTGDDTKAASAASPGAAAAAAAAASPASAAASPASATPAAASATAAPSSSGAHAPRKGNKGEKQAQAMQTGTLKKLFREKGFGFVAPDGGSAADVFLHFSDLASGGSDSMVAGMRVRYYGEVDAQTGKVRARGVAIVALGVDGKCILTAVSNAAVAQKGPLAKDDVKGRQEKMRRGRGKAYEDVAEAALASAAGAGAGAAVAAAGAAAAAAAAGAPRSAASAPEQVRTYGRDLLLTTFRRLCDAGRLQPRPKTLMLPWACEDVPAEKQQKRRRTHTVESGADGVGSSNETSAEAAFDDEADDTDEDEDERYSANHWTPEEALRHNSELSARFASSPQPWAPTSEETEDEDYPALPFDFEDEDEDEEAQPGEWRGEDKSRLPCDALWKRSFGLTSDLDDSTGASPESESSDLSSADSTMRRPTTSFDSLQGCRVDGAKLARATPVR